MFDFNIPARPDPERPFPSVGNTKLHQRRINGTRHRVPGGAKGKYKLVSYCPVCPPGSMGETPNHPEMGSKAVVQANTKKGACKQKHVWVVGGHSHTSDQNIVLVGATV